MMIDISSENFKNVFTQESLSLPRRWNGKNFVSTIRDDLFKSYLTAIEHKICESDFRGLASLCDDIVDAIQCYFCGYPSRALERFRNVMETLMRNPMKTYNKTEWDDYFSENGDPLKLFRVRNVQQNTEYSRADIFHTPYNLRSKVSTCRYSIAGFPSLYLGTSLELCCEETKASSLKDMPIASRFELVRNRHKNNTIIRVIELAIKPQDFFSEEHFNNRTEYGMDGRYFPHLNLDNTRIRGAFASWYPLIAAASFIRVNKSDPFAAEYIVPQLLMQWIRSKYDQEELYGIRYFSCASIRASDMGFNYVFPVSGKQYQDNSQFCDVLSRSFRLTKPTFLHEHESLRDCQQFLVRDDYVDYIL